MRLPAERGGRAAGIWGSVPAVVALATRGYRPQIQRAPQPIPVAGCNCDSRYDDGYFEIWSGNKCHKNHLRGNTSDERDLHTIYAFRAQAFTHEWENDLDPFYRCCPCHRIAALLPADLPFAAGLASQNYTIEDSSERRFASGGCLVFG